VSHNSLDPLREVRGMIDRAQKRLDVPGTREIGDDFQHQLLIGQDSLLVVMGAVLAMMERSNGNGRWGKVKKQGPGILSGAGIGSIIVSVLNALT
jgi:hypothetical protein